MLTKKMGFANFSFRRSRRRGAAQPNYESLLSVGHVLKDHSFACEGSNINRPKGCPTNGGNLKTMEEKRVISKSAQPLMDILCKELCKNAEHLVYGIGQEKLTINLLNDLAIMTLGTQLRGGANVKLEVLTPIRLFLKY